MFVTVISIGVGDGIGVGVASAASVGLTALRTLAGNVPDLREMSVLPVTTEHAATQTRVIGILLFKKADSIVCFFIGSVRCAAMESAGAAEWE